MARFFDGPHTDYQVTSAIKDALGMEDETDIAIGKFLPVLLSSRGFSESAGEVWKQTAIKVSEVNTGKLSVEDFASWFDAAFPGEGVVREWAMRYPHQAQLGREIQRLRERRSMTRTQFAAALVVAPSQVKRWEDGETFPSNSAIIEMARVLGVNSWKLWCLGNGVEV